MKEATTPLSGRENFDSIRASRTWSKPYPTPKVSSVDWPSSSPVPVESSEPLDEPSSADKKQKPIAS